MFISESKDINSLYSERIMESQQDQILIYKTETGQTQIDVRVEEETVWLSQDQMAQLFGQTKQNISLHIRNIYKEGELEESSTVKDYLTVKKLHLDTFEFIGHYPAKCVKLK